MMPEKKAVEFFRELEEEDSEVLALRAMLAMVSEDTKLPEIVSLIGPENALKLLLHFGGERVSFPQPDLFAKAVNASGAVLAVFREEMGLKEASSHFKTPQRLISKGVGTLKKQKALRKRLRDRYRASLNR